MQWFGVSDFKTQDRFADVPEKVFVRAGSCPVCAAGLRELMERGDRRSPSACAARPALPTEQKGKEFAMRILWGRAGLGRQAF